MPMIDVYSPAGTFADKHALAQALDRDKQLAVVERFTSLVAEAAADESLAARTWVLLTEAVPGGWGLAGHANANDELVAAARAEIARLSGKEG